MLHLWSYIAHRHIRLVKWNQSWIVVSLFRFIWHQTEFRLVSNILNKNQTSVKSSKRYISPVWPDRNSIWQLISQKLSEFLYMKLYYRHYSNFVNYFKKHLVILLNNQVFSKSFNYAAEFIIAVSFNKTYSCT